MALLQRSLNTYRGETTSIPSHWNLWTGHPNKQTNKLDRVMSTASCSLNPKTGQYKYDKGLQDNIGLPAPPSGLIDV